jgi:hypothetical protein
MKRTALACAAAILLTLLSACTEPAAQTGSPRQRDPAQTVPAEETAMPEPAQTVPAEETAAPEPAQTVPAEENEEAEENATPEPTDLRHTVGEGVSIRYTTTSEDAELRITGVPSYGDKTSPNVYGELTKGNSSDYELICLIIVGTSIFGKKPYNDNPNAFVKPDNTFTLPFSSSDGQGTDWNASTILVYLVPSGYEDPIEPDVMAGYVVPPAQVNQLAEDSVCVVQIDREVVVT